jgi:hypothetical protein
MEVNTGSAARETVTGTVAETDGSAADVAVKTKAPAVPGAVYRPLGVIVPVTESPPAIFVSPPPLTVHATAALELPVTVGVNCNCSRVPMEADVGAIVISTPEIIVAKVMPNTLGFWTLVATMMKPSGLGIVAGAE